MIDPVLDIRDLHIVYGTLHVLRGIDLLVPSGEVFGLLGPNGAGKTTLIHTILGLVKPKHGTVRVFGSEAIQTVLANIGYLPERQRYHPHVTAREYLVTLGKLSGVPGTSLTQKVTQVLQVMNLVDAADRRLGTYSKGMLQRIGLAQAILHDPDLLIIDEPTSGLDPSGQQEMVALLHQLRAAGHTIVMCTHQLAHVTDLCTRVGVLVEGRIDHLARVTDIQAEGRGVEIEVATLPPTTAQKLVTFGAQIRPNQPNITLYPADDALVALVLRRLLDDGVAVRAITPQANALDHFYARAVDLAPTREFGAGPVTAQFRSVTNRFDPHVDSGQLEPITNQTESMTEQIEPVTEHIEPVTEHIEPVTEPLTQEMQSQHLQRKQKQTGKLID